MMPLAVADLGKEVTIQSSSFKGELKRRTECLGLIPGEKVTPVSKNDAGLIIKIKDCRFAVNFGIASRIFVV